VGIDQAYGRRAARVNAGERAGSAFDPATPAAVSEARTDRLPLSTARARRRLTADARAVLTARGEIPVADIEAHITGTVWKIEVAVGDAVAEGDTVAILESMKMEMPVEAEDEGTVKEILVAEGQAVSEGDTLVVLE
jgi:acetyl-CoA carboxylase biotin carboxyl carrier protein